MKSALKKGAPYSKDEESISHLFNTISPYYDRINQLLSFGLDRFWRRVLIRRVIKNGGRSLLDIACGTGEVTVEFVKKGVKVVGVDIAEEMLEIAEIKSKKVYQKLEKKGNQNFIPAQYIHSSVTEMPLESGQFDAATIAFGIRNFQNRAEALQEIKRVLKESAPLYILEFSNPKYRPFKELYSLYFNKLVPFIGGLISKDKAAYSYLPDSVNSFPTPKEFVKELKSAGFNKIEYRALTLGVAYLYQATKEIESS